jgi:hypothetical protein
MKCPECQTHIKSKHYDPEFEWYECPECEGCFTAAELVDESHSDATRAKPTASAKKRLEEAEKEAEAVSEHEKAMLKPVKSQEKDETRHRDSVPTGQILNIMADEIEEIVVEAGGSIDRLNAREFYAMNLWRPLAIHAKISAREQEVDHVLCKDHR